MPKTTITTARQSRRIYLDIVEVNVSGELRRALSAATGAPVDCHMLLDRGALPLLQGIGAGNIDLGRECNTLAHVVDTNGVVIVCPREE